MRSIAPIGLAVLVAACGTAQDPSASVRDPTEIEPTTDSEASDAELRCEPVNYYCGCTWDCALVREMDGVFVRLDSEGEQQFVRDDCTRGPCFQVCEGEACAPALVMESNACEESCPPSRAPHACARVPGERSDSTGRPCQPG